MTLPYYETSRDGGTYAHLWPSREQRLLLTAALAPDDEALAAFRTWQASIDITGDFGWESVRLLPLVYHRLQVIGAREPLMGRLKGVYRKAWFENHRLFHDTEPVVAHLLANGIDVLLLKGAPLIGSYYANHALRPMTDLDIAIRPDALRRALTLLEQIGWRCTTDPNERRLRFVHALQFRGPESGEVDLHYRVLVEANRAGSDDTFWAHTESAAFGGTIVRQLDPTFMLLHVIMHGVRWNVETPIRWIPDAFTIIRERGTSIDWPRLVSFAKEQRLTHRLGLGLEYLANEFDAKIPADVVRALRDRRPSLVERAENTVLFSDVRKFSGAIGNQWMNLVELSRCPSAATIPGFIAELPHFLAYRWDLDGRREILPFLARGLVRTITRSSRPPIADHR